MGDAYSAVMDVISYVCSAYSVKAGAPLFLNTFTVKIAVSLHSTQLLTSLIVQRNLPRPKVFGGRWSRVLEGLISSSLQVARLLLKNTLRGFFLCFRHGLPRVNGEQGMARW